MEDALGKPVLHSRQHFLNYNENTFRYLAKAGIKYDSTIGSRNLVEYNAEYNREYVIYSDENGDLIEQPFLMMDTHLISDPKKMLADLEKAVSNLKENDGTAVVIWHNNNYETTQQKELYEKVLSILAP